MSILKISFKNIKSKPFYTFLSVFMLALSIALLLGIQQIKTSFEYQMENNLGKIDLVIGAKGSPLQLVLASVLHLDNPTGNISYHEAKKIGKNPLIKSAVPISYGDNYKGYRIVGSTDNFLIIYNAKLAKGNKVKKSFEVLLGSTVAKQLNLKIGDTFLSSHGLIENDIHVHNYQLTVVGILKPTQKVIDRLIVTNLESVWDVHHHEEENHSKHIHESEDRHPEHHNNEIHKEEIHFEKHKHQNEHKEITSLLITFRSPHALLTFPRKINKETNMQVVLPKFELDRLYEFTGIGIKTISLIAYLILLISGVSIFMSLYKMVKERSFELAILRTYGASNFQLIKMVVYEAFIIVFTAFIIGLLFVKAVIYFICKLINSNSKINILQNLTFEDIMQTGFLIFIMIILSIVLAIYPIIKMNISTILSNEK